MLRRSLLLSRAALTSGALRLSRHHAIAALRLAPPAAAPPRGSRRLTTAGQYASLAGVSIDALHEAFDDFADGAPQLQIDVESTGDVLTIAVGSRGTFVINKQSPNKQLWLSSPISGPSRYDFCPSTLRWVHTRDQTPLLDILRDDFETLVGERLSFARVAEELQRAWEDSQGRGGGEGPCH
ncbi:hypothetical protein AB1Y20_013345 [Prymnesium parvum]|uniref:ferroxidase n=1 Tax=Prymnesium parvum TaxID=97485 RepID=A0AB34INZ2_PRYPA